MTRPRTWLAVCILATIIVVVVVWGFLGSIPMNVDGLGSFLHRGERFQKGGERRSLFAALASRLRGSQTVFGLILAVTLMLIVPGLLLPAFIQSFTDDVLIRGFKTSDFLISGENL